MIFAKRRSKCALMIVAIASALTLSRGADAQSPVSLIVFPGGFNWPIWVAQEKGYFASNGLDVKLTFTPNSVFQLTNLIAPFDVIARANGFNILQRAIDVYGHYQGLAGAARRSWAAENRDKLIGYIRGYRDGLSWLFDPTHKEEAIGILRKNLAQMSPEV